jgi:Interferon-induced transmembrane protein/zinc-ribbon domain
MFCNVCGHQNPDNATTCGKCGASFVNPYQTPTAHGGIPPKINNYLIPAIFSTLCCCLPFGIVSIVYAAQVNGKLSGGDVAGAMQSASNAKMWFWISFGLGLVFQAGYVALMILGALAEANKGGFNP